MSRRHASVGGMRRDIRDGRRGGGAAATYQSIFGAFLVEMWHSQLGIATVSGNVDTWTGQIGSRVLQAPSSTNRPPYTNDGTAFGGKSVVQSANTGALCVTSTTLASMAAAGTRPLIFSRGRWRGLTPGFQTFVDAGDAAGAGLRIRIDGGIVKSQASFVTVAASSAANVDTAVHTFSAWTDGANANYRIDGTVAQVATTVDSLPNNMVAMTVGSNTARTLGSQYSAALVIVLSGFPGAAAMTAAETLAATDFPP